MDISRDSLVNSNDQVFDVDVPRVLPPLSTTESAGGLPNAERRSSFPSFRFALAIFWTRAASFSRRRTRPFATSPPPPPPYLYPHTTAAMGRIKKKGMHT